MSNLVLRANLSRPLTHNELDANMQFLEIVEWSAKDFRAGQFAYVTVTGTTTLYLCLETHTAFVYDNNGGDFAETITVNGTPITFWRKISGSGGGGSSAAFIDATFDSGTNILTLIGGDGSSVDVDLSSLANSGTGTSGSAGSAGSAGSSGLSYGTSGHDGTSGQNGTSGNNGTSGLGGTAGSSGTSGSTGSSASAGSSGSSGHGSSGTSGSSGSSGTAGQGGTAGTSGLSYGTSGSDGASGIAGTAGTSGTSPAGGGSTGVYFVKLQYSSGSLASAPGCFMVAQDPLGNNLLTTSGWVFTRVGANEVTITHPENKFAVNAMTHAENTAGNFLSKAVSGASTGVGSLIQVFSSKDTLNFKALSGTQTGLNTGAGPYFMYLTWTFPDNDFAV